MISIAEVAQAVEHILGKNEVVGSNPIFGSMKKVEKYTMKETISIGERTTKRLKCSCQHPFQDQRCGSQIRIHNKIVKGWRCTVCGTSRT